MNGYSKEDFEQNKEIIYSNTVQSLGSIVRAMETLSIPYENPARESDGTIGNNENIYFKNISSIQILNSIGCYKPIC